MRSTENGHTPTLFPETVPLNRHRFDVGDGHRLYVEECGNAAGLPVVFLHGGPGSGCQPGHRRLFDPKMFRIILVDQRGAGQSTPKRSREANTTDHLIADLEFVRKALGIDKWMVVGGSWGATLAVAYAEAHRDRVSGMVLRAVFLGTEDEVRWAFLEGPKTFYPELHRQFLQLLPAEEQDDPLAAYTRRLFGSDEQIALAAGRVWHDYERALSELSPARIKLPSSFEEAFVTTTAPPNTPYIEAHFFRNRCFLQPGQLLAEAGKLSNIPGIVVQGRYDMLCPPKTAHALVDRWGTAELRLVSAAGHSAMEPGVQDALLPAIQEMGERLNG